LTRHGRADRAEAELRKIVTTYERRGPKYRLEELRARAFLADALRENDNLTESEQQYRRILSADDRILSESDSITLGSRFGLAAISHLRGENAVAAHQFKELLDDQTRILGATNSATVGTRWQLATVLYETGDYDEAERLLTDIWNPGMQHSTVIDDT